MLTAADLRYNIYSRHLIEKFGARVYKLPVNLRGSCPNRDGLIGTGGCSFCERTGSGFECLPKEMSVKDQLQANRRYFKERYGAEKFIAYFQAFSNTYMPIDEFRQYVSEALDKDIAGISISTRPDCINEEYLEVLSKVKDNRGLAINIELGLQTVNYHTLLKVRRGHTLAEFIDAVGRIHRRGFEICAHLILNLPWDNMDDVIENSKMISALHIRYVKLHSLYLVEGTEMARQFSQGDFSLITLDEYVERVVTFLEYLDPGTVIQRLVGKGPREGLIFSNWGASWWKIKQLVEGELVSRDTRQGKKFDYLNGHVLVKRGFV